MGLMTHLMVSHTWSIKGSEQREALVLHILSFKGSQWTQLRLMSHVLYRDLTQTFIIFNIIPDSSSFP